MSEKYSNDVLKVMKELEEFDKKLEDQEFIAKLQKRADASGISARYRNFTLPIKIRNNIDIVKRL